MIKELKRVANLCSYIQNFLSFSTEVLNSRKPLTPTKWDIRSLRCLSHVKGEGRELSGRVAQTIKCLLGQCGDLIPIPRPNVGKPGMMAHTCGLSTGKAKLRDSWCSASPGQ